ncbi:SprT family protein [Limosilactobacillus sp. STM2_1]|uniref:SprT family protein n=1 Tax=Limosilactobacillus rudii TaxID=2759755 RepID=A0A7W3UNS9_9LACO|nr:SprT family protein [Limosilactobacillus rudii]MBB1080444.1 SprT family protein [Limosilactobacillus rudii]MBB1098470.1 SprT family protein [Limosilactobacillus rudii]MCD7135478.1 SprT family protein [Limosilactobacillus rudii]
MTNEELQRLTEQWSEEYFNRPFNHQVFFNKRLKTTGGRYHLGDHHIDINPLMYTEFDLDNLRGVVLHELCHYHLHLAGMDYHHRSHAFRTLLAQVGGSRFAPPTSKRRVDVRKKWHYQCTGCGVKIARQRRFNTHRYVCRRCGHHFILKN